jgi:hypothetical protein
MSTPNRYPDANVLAQLDHWDDATREVVLDRVHNVPEFTFFTSAERATLEALCERVVPQGHRPASRRTPIAAWIDQRCAHNLGDGFRFDDMPPNPTAWRLGLAGVQQGSQALYAASFHQLDAARQNQILELIRAGDPPGEIWQRLPAKRWWVFVALRQITGVYYAHPYAWDEIGFGGPAYPRGYFALNNGYPEPWEPREASEPKDRSLLQRWRIA